MVDETTKLKLIPDDVEAAPIPKPEGFSLDRFTSKSASTVANVETLQTALPHYTISQAKDFVRLHSDETKYWSPELCFVNVPIKGQKNTILHPIDEALAMRFLPSAMILRFRLALATKPYDIFFLCHVPTRNEGNTWNDSNRQACEQAKTLWVLVTSRKAEGVEAYKIDASRDPDAFPEPKWPSQTLNELIYVTYAGRMIVTEDHPGLLRLIGKKQIVS
jgi:hypothetical protein